MNFEGSAEQLCPYRLAIISRGVAQGGALQERWSQFARLSVPFLTKIAALGIQGGAPALEVRHRGTSRASPGPVTTAQRCLSAALTQRNGAELARDARIIMEKLGPTYVKLGQVISVRPDVLPPAALRELAILQASCSSFHRAHRVPGSPWQGLMGPPDSLDIPTQISPVSGFSLPLQDSVKPFDTSVAIEQIESELGCQLGAVFSEISEQPVAAASLAQVYKVWTPRPQLRWMPATGGVSGHPDSPASCRPGC